MDNRPDQKESFDCFWMRKGKVQCKPSAGRVPDDNRALHMHSTHDFAKIVFGNKWSLRRLGPPISPAVVAHDVIFGAERGPHVIPGNGMHQAVMKDRKSGV